ncbi:membrane protein YoeI [Buttiauxella warmboldiae]|uniref:Membrane protein YoeI n=1 Tax=Buttiauxella warmboldiae TaxID=82993 RepID=A0A3N5DKI7_9ENTR|nr:membrane protein YoeI [Buttiauxella warmboldiae]
MGQFFAFAQVPFAVWENDHVA